MMNLISFFQDIGISGFFDIIFMWLLLYTLLVWAKKTRAASVLTGIIIVAAFYLLARQFNLTLTAAVFEKFFAVILIALVVIFQEELRHFFERIAVLTSLNRRVRRRQFQRILREEVGALVRTVHDLAKERIGALIVIRGRDLIVRHLEGGVDLGGKLSEPMLRSIFDPGSMGHDGAVVIEGATVLQFSVQLPLSKNLKKMGKGGTRHAAALGISELSDALCIVVSEERGTISIARHGDLTEMKGGAEKLMDVLEKFYQEIHPKKRKKPLEGYLSRNWREKLYALVLAVLLWIVLVFGSKALYKTFIVPVTHAPLSKPWSVSELEPKKVYVTLGGPRNAFYFLDKNRLKVRIDIPEILGENRIRIYPTDLDFPKDLVLEVLAPQEVKVKVEKIVALETRGERKTGAELLKGRRNRIWPFRKKAAEEDSKKEGQKEEASDEFKPGVEAVPDAGQAASEAVVETVETLVNVEPEEVIKFLEKSLDSQTPIEPLHAENGSEAGEKESR